MSTDDWRAGYQAARSYYVGQTHAGQAAGREWARPERADVAALVRKHWPELAERLDVIVVPDA